MRPRSNRMVAPRLCGGGCAACLHRQIASGVMIMILLIAQPIFTGRLRRYTLKTIKYCLLWLAKVHPHRFGRRHRAVCGGCILRAVASLSCIALYAKERSCSARRPGESNPGRARAPGLLDLQRAPMPPYAGGLHRWPAKIKVYVSIMDEKYSSCTLARQSN